MIPRYQLLATRIRDGLEALERSLHRIERAWQGAQRRQADQDMYLDSAALNLHGFYSGLEQIFQHIAEELDGGLPKGEAWHRELLRQMTMGIGGVRPAIISAETAHRLDEYRRFRHVVRNVYAEYLEPERVGKLVGELAGLWERIKSELVQFAEFLEGVSRADDSETGQSATLS
jgi:hypothetical protein